jgi:hypothetical protein
MSRHTCEDRKAVIFQKVVNARRPGRRVAPGVGAFMSKEDILSGIAAPTLSNLNGFSPVSELCSDPRFFSVPSPEKSSQKKAHGRVHGAEGVPVS